jgi:hypothetical protein
MQKDVRLAQLYLTLLTHYPDQSRRLVRGMGGIVNDLARARRSDPYRGTFLQDRALPTLLLGPVGLPGVAPSDPSELVDEFRDARNRLVQAMLASTPAGFR